MHRVFGRKSIARSLQLLQRNSVFPLELAAQITPAKEETQNYYYVQFWKIDSIAQFQRAKPLPHFGTILNSKKSNLTKLFYVV
jgi:hypothetical protein